MEKLEEIDELRLDFTKLEKVGGQVTATRASGASSCDPGVIPAETVFEGEFDASGCPQDEPPHFVDPSW